MVSWWDAVGVGGFLFCQVKTQSAKICLNFNFQGGGREGDVLPRQNPKCQDLSKFQFLGGGGGGGGGSVPNFRIGCSCQFGQKILEA